MGHFQKMPQSYQLRRSLTPEQIAEGRRRAAAMGPLSRGPPPNETICRFDIISRNAETLLIHLPQTVLGCEQSSRFKIDLAGGTHLYFRYPARFGVARTDPGM
jgi:hypothetical protein